MNLLIMNLFQHQQQLQWYVVSSFCISYLSLSDHFLEMLTKAQSSRIDDQRGLSIDVGDLPEFLKSSGSSDQQSETDEGSMSPPQSRIDRDGAHSLSSSYHR